MTYIKENKGNRISILNRRIEIEEKIITKLSLGAFFLFLFLLEEKNQLTGL